MIIKTPEVAKHLLSGLSLDRIEIADAAHMPDALLGLLFDLQKPFDVFLADAGLWCPPGTRLTSANTVAPLSSHALRVETWQARSRSILAQAEQVYAPCAEARALFEAWFPELSAQLLEPVRTRKQPASFDRKRPCCGVLLPDSDADAIGLLKALARACRDRHPNLVFVVLGETLADDVLMSFENICVTGPFDDSELDEIFHFYRLTQFLNASRQPLFGHPMFQAAQAHDLEIARFSWIAASADEEGLVLDPELSNEQVAGSFVQWMAQDP